MAARFHFRLESLLRVRLSLENEAKRRLARIILHRDRLRAQVEDLQETHQATVRGRRTDPREPVDLERWRATERFLLVLERRLQEAAQALAEAEAQVDQARQALVKAHQDQLVLQRLKERRLEQHTHEINLEEARDMDEIAVLRYPLTHPPAPSPS